LVGENFDNGLDNQDKSEGSGNQLPTTTLENASDIDWDAFLWEKEMLPASNWEEEFLKHKAKFIDGYSYKGLLEAQEPEESADSQDQPWYPYDPENVLDTHLEFEVDERKSTDEAQGQTKICYGIVSFQCPLCSTKIHKLVELRVDILKPS
jgi:hypothetical protein